MICGAAIPTANCPKGRATGMSKSYHNKERNCSVCPQIAGWRHRLCGHGEVKIGAICGQISRLQKNDKKTPKNKAKTRVSLDKKYWGCYYILVIQYEDYVLRSSL
ncbi:MAG: hypothetical protein LBT00_06210 [Spirochaetaceae bacterium]|nr:hypothetical protein [Spirochaetaceae bacterium]